MTIIAAVIAAYLVGSVPFGYLIVRMILKDDIRNHGSGNIGATNVGRVLGRKWGVVVLILDAIKGLLPTLLFADAIASSIAESQVLHIRIACAIAAVVGHMYPCWLKFRGGKGVATAMGAVMVLGPVAMLASMVTFGLAFLITRTVGISSVVAAITFSVTQLGLLGERLLAPDVISLTVFSLVVPAMIIWRHRSNLSALWSARNAKFESPTVTVTDNPSDPT